MKAIKKFRYFLSLSFLEQRLFFEALLLVYAAKCISLSVPFKYSMRMVSRRKQTEDESVISEDEKELLPFIKTAVRQTASFTFWKNVCLVQSMAATWMLQRRNIPSKLIFGFNFDEQKKFIAHAWVTAGEYEIVAKSGDYRELHTL